ncbi:MAG TPA: TonB-dependent receptor [Ignavibacteriaceae bacterium]|jgi:hypothetical protein|nr:TonB-dependent receptor [Ignavibacteriaceae bacterium]HOJ18252.1 TonB-dependent receptor [Ignavibacteriaceae bacterium]HPO55840.1 TonB-dependent receptor [Ignavibacteriaceae bacterium]
MISLNKYMQKDNFSLSHPKSFLILLISLLMIAGLHGQGQRGKLTGTVKDAGTGEPIVGANVMLVGTTIGGAADLNGKFSILNIPGGTYSVTASALGYAKLTISEVDIIVDRTTELKFELKDATVQLEQVVIVAEKPKIIKDQTSTSTTLNETQIKSAPIEGLRGALDFNAGLQKSATGNYSVRGSSSYELNFQVNGVEQVNSATSGPGTFGTEKSNNSWKYDVNPIGVAQMQLITGGFSAEYGNAQAGVVKVVLKEGAPKFTGEFRMEYRPAGQYHYGSYLYDQNNYEWTKWGNLDNWIARAKKSSGGYDENFLLSLGITAVNRYGWLYDKIKSNTATADERQLFESVVDREVRWAHELWVRNHTPSENNPLGVYDYRNGAYQRYMFGFGGPLGKDPNKLKFYFSGEYKHNPTRLPTAEQTQVYQNYIANLTYQPIPNHKFKGMLSFQKYRGGIWSGSDDIRWSGIAFTPPGLSSKYYVNIDPVRTEQTIAQSLNYIYIINNQASIEATLTHQYEKYELPYRYLPGYTQIRDVLDSLYDPQGSVLRAGIWWETDYFRAPDAFSTLYFQDTRTDHWSLSVDYTNQILETNLLKAGARAYYWDMFNTGVNSSFLANSYITRAGFAEYYRAYPTNFAVYVQDKMEYSGMIANIGVRAESYNFGTLYPIDIYNMFYPGKPVLNNPGNPLKEQSKTQFIILPRIGISFPVGENTAFRIQYGHFSSMPIFSHALSNRTQSGWTGMGNPNLEPKKTIQYEFGLQQMLEDEHRLDVALYYNDRVTQIGLLPVASYTGSNTRSAGFSATGEPLYFYTTFDNNAFGATIGAEFTFEKINFQNWSYRLSYSLSQTTEGTYGPSSIYPDLDRNYLSRKSGETVGYSDRTHNLRGLLQYRFNKGEGPSILGIYILENTILSMTYTMQSGAPYTYITGFDLKDVVNNRRYPIESVFDFNLTKNITIDDLRLILGLRIMNLFDNKWLTPISTTEDITNWVEYGYTTADLGNDPLRKSYITAEFKAYRNIPRQIFFTVGLGF